MIDILIPTYKRSHRIQKQFDNIKSTTKNEFNCVYLVEQSDQDSINVLSNIICTTIVGNFQSYSNAINAGYWLTRGEFLFQALDDMEFTDGWDVEPINILKSRQDIHLVSSDLDGQIGGFFTIRRSYVSINSMVEGFPNHLLYPYYHHESDREMYWTAKNRGVLVECKTSLIHHKHEWDKTQIKTTMMDETDKKTYWDRRRLFRGA